MTGKTTIEWTDQPGYRGAVWNPTTGCTRVSAGCDNCYAFALHDKRHAANLKANKGLISPSTSPAALRKAGHPLLLPWPKQYDLPFSRVQLLEDRLDVPLRTRTPTCYFVDSMADLFHEDVPVEFIGRVFEELWDAIKADEPQERVLAELVQVAAMCFRYFETGDRYRGPHPVDA